jgi:hypothetical protein
MEKTIQLNLDEYLHLKEFHDAVKKDAQLIDMSRFYSTSLVHHQTYLYISKDDFAKKYQKEFFELQNENSKLRLKIDELKYRNLFQRILNK